MAVDPLKPYKVNPQENVLSSISTPDSPTFFSTSPPLHSNGAVSTPIDTALFAAVNLTLIYT